MIAPDLTKDATKMGNTSDSHVPAWLRYAVANNLRNENIMATDYMKDVSKRRNLFNQPVPYFWKEGVVSNNRRSENMMAPDPMKDVAAIGDTSNSSGNQRWEKEIVSNNRRIENMMDAVDIKEQGARGGMRRKSIQGSEQKATTDHKRDVIEKKIYHEY